MKFLNRNTRNRPNMRRRSTYKFESFQCCLTPSFWILHFWSLSLSLFHVFFYLLSFLSFFICITPIRKPPSLVASPSQNLIFVLPFHTTSLPLSPCHASTMFRSLSLSSFVAISFSFQTSIITQFTSICLQIPCSVILRAFRSKFQKPQFSFIAFVI